MLVATFADHKIAVTNGMRIGLDDGRTSSGESFAWDHVGACERARRSSRNLSARDTRILSLARQRLCGVHAFDDAIRALREAVEEAIPAGRIFLLGTTEHGPILGSVISGIGISDGADGVHIVRVDRAGRTTVLGRLST